MFDKRTLPLSALRAFSSAAQHLHMGRAGEELGVTHGAISHQVRSLENKLGVELFVRTNNRLKLTPAGSRLYESVNNGLNTLLEGTYNLKTDDLTGPLLVACTQTIATSWAIKHICEFQLDYPTTQVIVSHIAPNTKTIPPEVDIAICYGNPGDMGKRTIELAKPRLFPVCSPSLLEQFRGNNFMRALQQVLLLHDNHASWDRWFMEHTGEARNNHLNITFPNTSQALTAARLGYGVALCNQFETREFIKDGQLVTLVEKSIKEEQSYFLYSRHQRSDSLKARIFEDWMLDRCS